MGPADADAETGQRPAALPPPQATGDGGGSRALEPTRVLPPSRAGGHQRPGGQAPRSDTAHRDGTAAERNSPAPTAAQARRQRRGARRGRADSPPVRAALSAADLHDARRAAVGPAIRPAAGQDGATGPGQVQPTIHYMVAAWLLSRRSADTRDGYARELTHWLTELDDQGLDPLAATRATGDLYAQALYEAGFSDATIRRKIAAISSFYSYAAEENWIAANPVRKVTVPDRPPPSTDQASEADIRALIAAADAWVEQAPSARRADEVVYAHRARALIYLLGGLGVRVNEVRLLDAEDLARLEDGRRRARFSAKGGGTVDRLVPEAVGQVLDAYQHAAAHPGHGPLLATRTGRYLARDKPWRILQQLAERAGVRVHPHMLRVAFITVSLEDGRPIQEVSDAANHASIDQTQKYNRARRRLDKDPAAHRMSSLLTDGSTAPTATAAGSASGASAAADRVHPLTSDERSELERLRAERQHWLSGAPEPDEDGAQNR